MRRPRLKVENGIYHCISRITGGHFWITEEGKGMWCDQLRRVSQFCGVEVLTYAVLDNHFHLLVRVPQPGRLTDAELADRYRALYPHRPKLVLKVEETLADGGSQAEEMRTRLLARMHDVSMFLKELKQRFTMWFNARNRLFGTIWAERFKSILVENDASVLRTVGAYIDLNPIRAKITTKPEAYLWCGMAAAERGDSLARAGLISLVRAKSWSEARKAYRRFVYDASLSPVKDRSRETMKVENDDELLAETFLMTRQPALSEGWIIGSPRFVGERREAYRVGTAELAT
jgi:REP element-mobilizing transposase RayT